VGRGSKASQVRRRSCRGRRREPCLCEAIRYNETRPGEIREHYRGREHDFELCAVELWRLIAPAIGRCDVTQPSRDGGRDAIGEYILGPASDPIGIDFALEAKCYTDTNTVGVREVARLISRLRHRHFGVFVTTSSYNKQVYAEVRTDGHPIALISGADIVTTLRDHGHGGLTAVRAWLETIERR
jgi:hypothetical protein